MALIPLDIPAGFYRNGTDIEQAGRWRDGSLVRWRDNSLRPIGGWRDRKTSFCTNPVRGMHAWEDNTANTWLAGASHDAIIVMTGGGTTTDLTPLDLATGREDAAANAGYGGGAYNTGIYGQPRQITQNTVPLEATTVSLDNWGEYLLACHYDDGRILEWQTSTELGDELVSNGDFSTIPDTSWTAATGWTISSSGTYPNTATHNYPTATTLTQDISVNAAEHRITFDVGGLNANNTIRVRIGVDIFGPDEVIYFSEEVANGSHSFDFDVTTAGTVTIMVNKLQTVTPAWYIDNISVKQSAGLVAVQNAPTDNLAIVVTEERFVFALGAGGNPRKVQWCDFESNTVWTPSTTNQAGSQELQTSGQIMLGIRTRGQTLILTDIDAHAARYSGPPYIYNFQRVGTSCGAISRKAASDVDMGVFWMGESGFFRFDGNSVSELGCDVHDYVFGDINLGQKSKIWSVANSKHGEIWWFYCSSGATEIDRYVAFDYKENHWLIGDLSRTSGVPGGVFPYPILAGHNADSDLYDHEVGINFDGATTFAETGPMSVGNGDNITKITKLLPDEKTQGDVSVTFKTRFYPNEADATHGPFTPDNPTSVRFSGRQFRMRVEGERLADWRVGTMRVDAVSGGTR
jgi:hypothetical protein